MDSKVDIMKKKMSQRAENKSVQKAYEYVRCLNKTEDKRLGYNLSAIHTDYKQFQNWIQVEKSKFIKRRRKSFLITRSADDKLERIGAPDSCRPHSVFEGRQSNKVKKCDLPSILPTPLNYKMFAKTDDKGDKTRVFVTRKTSTGTLVSLGDSDTESLSVKDEKQDADTLSSVDGFFNDETLMVTASTSNVSFSNEVESCKDTHRPSVIPSTRTRKQDDQHDKMVLSKEKHGGRRDVRHASPLDAYPEAPRFNVPPFKRLGPMRVKSMQHNVGLNNVAHAKTTASFLHHVIKPSSAPAMPRVAVHEIARSEPIVDVDAEDIVEFPLCLSLTKEEKIQHRIKMRQKDVDKCKDHYMENEHRECQEKLRKWLQDIAYVTNKTKQKGK